MNHLPEKAKQDILNLRNSIVVFKHFGTFNEFDNTYYLDEYSMKFTSIKHNMEFIKDEQIFNIYLDDIEAIEYTKAGGLYTTQYKNDDAANIFIYFLNSKMLEMELENKNENKTIRRLKI